MSGFAVNADELRGVTCIAGLQSGGIFEGVGRDNTVVMVGSGNQNGRIRSAVIELVHYRDGKSDVNLSEYLSSSLGIDYSVLSKLFSESEGMTIERYFILQKIERVKELLFYGEMSLGEIAFKMNYSSTAHLSAQFKSVTGMTPTQFKTTGRKELTQLDRVGT